MPTAAVGMFTVNSHAHASVSMAPNDLFNRLLSDPDFDKRSWHGPRSTMMKWQQWLLLLLVLAGIWSLAGC
jgi:hypothetical protein